MFTYFIIIIKIILNLFFVDLQISFYIGYLILDLTSEEIGKIFTTSIKKDVTTDVDKGITDQAEKKKPGWYEKLVVAVLVLKFVIDG